MIEIKIKKLHPDAIIPSAGSLSAACFDVVATRIERISVNKVICYLGFATEIPEGYKGVIVPRSSFSHKGWVLGNHIGQIDSDYRGEWQMRFEAIPTGIYRSTSNILTYGDFPYKEGDRLGQIYFEKIQPITFTVVEDLTETERNEGGFGSTGL